MIHGQAVKFKESTWSSSNEFVSRVPGMGKLKWKNHDVMKGGDMRYGSGGECGGAV